MLIFLHRLTCSESGVGSYRILAPLRWVMVLIFLAFGPHKFMAQYQHGITVYLWNSPLTSWMSIFGEAGEADIIGTFEISTAVILSIGAFIPIASLIGAAMGMCTFALTWSYIFTTPGAVQFSLSSQPLIWNLMGQFLFKDIVLFMACFVLFLAALPRRPG